MQRIHKLSPRVANQIAAGEVITEPLSVIKELLENALDAGASDIRIEIKDSGLKQISIHDNGHGILYEDVDLLFERHCTSKIEVSSDLKNIQSYGFRGEALASIAAVSKVSLSSRHKDQLQGFETIIYGGRTLSMKRLSRQVGTSFIIEDLFYNTPVREGFLKKPGVLERNIINFLTAMALGNPQISLRFHSDEKLVLETFGRSREKVLIELLGEDARHLIPITMQAEGYRIDGYLSRLSFSKTNRRSQYFLVNNRLVENPELQKLIQKTYEGLLPSRRFPVVFLFIEIDPSKIDVNIHPRKMQVRFSENISLLKDLEDQLRPALYGKQIHPLIEEKQRPPKLSVEEKARTKVAEDIPLSFFTQVDLPVKSDPEEISEAAPAPYDEFFDDLHYLGQAFASFLVFEKATSLYFCDQHAAHEKILYEEFMEEYRKSKLAQQVLMLPQSLSLSASQLMVLEKKKGFLNDLGFSFDYFSGNDIVLRGVPHLFDTRQAEVFFLDILEGLDQHRDDDQLISQACKAAIKANDRLDRLEVDHLLQRLKTLDNPHTCPHGRPIFIEMPRKELERRFER
ncbi:MAG TPA: DNA mismatch repair endonuclease MutL [Clostridia bacterium]|nr:DNA mismatch repair endonuclease MutL [Clostridia bacterium]